MQQIVNTNLTLSKALPGVTAFKEIFTNIPLAMPNNNILITAVPTTVTTGINLISVQEQPTFIYIEKTLYTQVAGEPTIGEYNYNAITHQIKIVVPSKHNNKVIIIQNAIIAEMPPSQVGNPFNEKSTPLFDRVPANEIGLDFYEWLISIGAGHSGDLLLQYNHSKNDFPTLSIDIEVLKDNVSSVLEQLENSINAKQIHIVYGSCFYLKPCSFTIHDDSNIASIPLNFESIHAPREDYGPLDKYINIAKNTFTFFSAVTEYGVNMEGISPSITNRNNDKKERRKIRDLLVANAQSTASYIDYSKESIRLLRGKILHKLPDNFSILPEYTLSKNGLIGAPVVDGVRLSRPWIYKGWLPDDSNLSIKETKTFDDADDDDEPMVELRWIGDPDLEPSSPTKLLDGVGYSYRSTEEEDQFPLMAQNPSAVVYPGGFKKSYWQQKNEYGFNAGQINGEEWGWQINSSDVWDYIDPSEDNDFSVDPIWIYTPPVASAHWKKCRAWSLIVKFDVLGYPILEQEIGTRYIQPKTETDNRTVALLLYEADKLDYEANKLRESGNLSDANAKQLEAIAKRQDVGLYEFREVPYIKTTRKFYRKISLDRPEIRDVYKEKPCDGEERNDTNLLNRDAAYFLEREITEENSIISIANPYRGEANLSIGESYENRKWIVCSPGGFQTFESTANRVQQSGETINLSVGEWRTGTPEPAPKRPKIDIKKLLPRKDGIKKNQNQYINYLSVLGGDPVSFSESSQSTITLEGVRQFGAALPALLEMCREENLNSETTITDSPWYRIIQPGDTAFWMGKLWQCTTINRTDKLHPGGLIQCTSYRCDWGSYLANLSLSPQLIRNCVP